MSEKKESKKIEKLVYKWFLIDGYCFALMESNKNLQILIERAWAMNDRIRDKIQDNSFSFCRLCSEHGLFCGIAETPLEERERLIAIRDSLKDVENMLVFLQRLKSWQKRDQHAAHTRLEESRLILMEKVTQYRGRTLDVIEELNACFGDGRTAYNWNLQRTMEKKKRISSFLFDCIKSVINPWNWHRIAIKLTVVSAIISSTIKFYQTRKDYDSTGRRILSIVDSTTAGKKDFLLTAPNSPLDVSYGRG
ncbi:hypothetical protein F0562_015013 [Nyssa sinensis]|uniref:Uncharacterized protein n=1 Tax=Nyssa sinensis TaxID=561372 RepID=A0A5J4ZPW0_9ASTE|nr:hypothetical protein F0562_015013 [Nyssa sinensis]